MKNKVSIIIPCFNSARFIGQTLESICSQDFDSFECIVVNDGSSDGSKEIIQKYRRHDSRIRYIEHKANSHVSAARNTGIRAATGEYICFLDSDDLLTKESLSERYGTAVAARNRSDRYAGSYSSSIAIPEDADSPGEATPIQLGDIGLVTVNGKCPFNANQPMIYADIIRAVGGFSEALNQAEDYNTWLMILRAGYWFAPTRLRTVTYRSRVDSLVRKTPIQHLRNSLSLIDHCHKPLPQDQLSFSPYRMCYPLSTYERQYNKMNRILEFSGMALVVNGKAVAKDLCRLINDHLPNLRELSAQTSPLLGYVASGISRANPNVSDSEKKELLDLVEGIIDDANFEDSCASKLDSTSPFGKDRAAANRFWNSATSNVDVVFLPHKDYHVWSIGLIQNAMENLGLSSLVVDLTAQWREAGSRRKALELGIDLIGLSEFILGSYRPKLIVVFNDWDHVTRPIVVAAKDAGIGTVAIVEGIQDYNDADTGRVREAYRCVDSVLLPGAFDKRYFLDTNQTCMVAGVARIEDLLKKPQVSLNNPVPRVLINSNFSYGVLEEHRDLWLTQAVEAVLQLGFEPVISRHPADLGDLYPEFLSGDDFYKTLDSCDITVQRFASGVIEALARQRPVIYFNPHGERVDKFTHDPMDAYAVTSSKADLLKILEDWKFWRIRALEHGPAVLAAHAGIGEITVADRTAGALAKLVTSQNSIGDYLRFYENLKAIDIKTGALCHGTVNGVQLFSHTKGALESMKRLRQFYISGYGENFARLELAKCNHVSSKRKSSDVFFLLGEAASAFLDGKAYPNRFVSDPALCSKLIQACRSLGDDHPLVQHFNRISKYFMKEIQS